MEGGYPANLRSWLNCEHRNKWNVVRTSYPTMSYPNFSTYSNSEKERN